mgnify:CR=1 FL=1
MADTGLAQLIQLHLLDSSLHELKSRANALDVGQEETALFKHRAAETAEVRQRAKDLKQEEADLEAKTAALAAKKKAWHKKLYDGSVVSPREVENIESEIKSLTEQIELAEVRGMEILEILPTAQAEARNAEIELIRLKKKVEEKKAKANEDLKLLQAKHAEKAKFRGPIAEKVKPPLLAQYEAIRKKIGVPAMSEAREDGHCAACGLPVPTKTYERVRQDLVAACESCHRILYMPLGGI